MKTPTSRLLSTLLSSGLSNKVERIAYSDEIIDRKAIDYFLQKGIKADRIDASLVNEDTKVILDNLGLLTEDGSLKNAAVLLFAKRPQRYFTGVQFKLGRFGINESDLIFDDVVEGNILQDKYRTSSMQVQNLYDALGESELSVKEIMQLLGLKGRDNFLKKYLNPAIEASLIEPISPDQPRTPRQKYHRKK